MKIIQQNLGRIPERIPQIMNTVLKFCPDVIFFEEFCYPLHKHSVLDVLAANGYSTNLPVDFPAEAKISAKWNACCVIAWNSKTLSFMQAERTMIIQKCRYIEGVITDRLTNTSFPCFFGYVQQCYDGGDRKIKNKANMLTAIIQFKKEHANRPFFIGGDLNTDISSPHAKCRELMEVILDNATNTYVGVTWNSEQLDYAIISNCLNDKCCCKTTPIKETGSDHIALCTEIRFETNEK